jgi:hypothetical protein
VLTKSFGVFLVCIRTGGSFSLRNVLGHGQNLPEYVYGTVAFSAIPKLCHAPHKLSRMVPSLGLVALHIQLSSYFFHLVPIFCSVDSQDGRRVLLI